MLNYQRRESFIPCLSRPLSTAFTTSPPLLRMPRATSPSTPAFSGCVWSKLPSTRTTPAPTISSTPMPGAARARNSPFSSGATSLPLVQARALSRRPPSASPAGPPRWNNGGSTFPFTESLRATSTPNPDLICRASPSPTPKASRSASSPKTRERLTSPLTAPGRAARFHRKSRSSV